MLLARTRLLVATLWAGSLWAVGYLAAPTLFATLSDRVLAGTIAGNLFSNQAWLSIACAVVMLVLLGATQTSTGGIFAGPAANMAAKSRRTLFVIVLVINTVEEKRSAINDSRAIRTSSLAARVTTYTTLSLIHI